MKCHECHNEPPEGGRPPRGGRGLKWYVGKKRTVKIIVALLAEGVD